MPRVVGAVVLLLLGTGAFACLSMTLAALVRTRERFIEIGQLVVMPLFASSALYPLSILPGWLQVVAHANRSATRCTGCATSCWDLGGRALWLDFTVVAGFLLATALVAAKTYPRAIL